MSPISRRALDTSLWSAADIDERWNHAYTQWILASTIPRCRGGIKVRELVSQYSRLTGLVCLIAQRRRFYGTSHSRTNNKRNKGLRNIMGIVWIWVSILACMGGQRCAQGVSIFTESFWHMTFTQHVPLVSFMSSDNGSFCQVGYTPEPSSFLFSSSTSE
jgi:hypothetical protein